MNRDYSTKRNVGNSTPQPLCSIEITNSNNISKKTMVKPALGRRSSTGALISKRRRSLLVDYSKSRANDKDGKSPEDSSSSLRLSLSLHESSRSLGGSLHHRPRSRRPSGTFYHGQPPPTQQGKRPSLKLFEPRRSIRQRQPSLMLDKQSGMRVSTVLEMIGLEDLGDLSDSDSEAEDDQSSVKFGSLREEQEDEGDSDSSSSVCNSSSSSSEDDGSSASACSSDHSEVKFAIRRSILVRTADQDANRKTSTERLSESLMETSVAPQQEDVASRHSKGTATTVSSEQDQEEEVTAQDSTSIVVGSGKKDSPMQQGFDRASSHRDLREQLKKSLSSCLDGRSKSSGNLQGSSCNSNGASETINKEQRGQLRDFRRRTSLLLMEDDSSITVDHQRRRGSMEQDISVSNHAGGLSQSSSRRNLLMLPAAKVLEQTPSMRKLVAGGDHSNSERSSLASTERSPSRRNLLTRVPSRPGLLETGRGNSRSNLSPQSKSPSRRNLMSASSSRNNLLEKSSSRRNLMGKSSSRSNLEKSPIRRKNQLSKSPSRTALAGATAESSKLSRSSSKSNLPMSLASIGRSPSKRTLLSRSTSRSNLSSDKPSSRRNLMSRASSRSNLMDDSSRRGGLIRGASQTNLAGSSSRRNLLSRGSRLNLMDESQQRKLVSRAFSSNNLSSSLHTRNLLNRTCSSTGLRRNDSFGGNQGLKNATWSAGGANNSHFVTGSRIRRL